MKNKFYISNNKAYINVNHKKIGTYWAIIDLEDFDKVNQYKTTWNIGYKNNHIDGIKTKIQKNKKREVVWLHRLIMNCPNNKVVDHINGNTFDNQKNNLRIVTNAQNRTNLSSISKNKSGYTNIYLEKDGKYRVRINGKSFGRYKNLQDAIKIRDTHIKEIFNLRER